jgi:hypothetical protein
MRILLICFIVIISTPVMAQNTDAQPRLWDRIVTGQWFPSNWTFFNFTKEWDSSHWDGLDFQRSIDPERAVKNASLNPNRSMFAHTQAVTPQEFLNNMRSANIIGRVYNPEIGFFWDRHTADEVVIELGHNFYTLSYADQSVIMDMLSRAFPRQNYVLKYANTDKIAGHVTERGFYLY